MNMIFEPMDLAIASPATVSRCGMVYLQPKEMGWKHLYVSWRALLPTRFDEDQFKTLDSLVYTIIQPLIDYIRDEATETAPTEDQCLVVGCLRILRVCLKIFEVDSTWDNYDKK